MKTTNMETFSSILLEGLLDKIEHVEQAKVDARMLMAAKIADAMKAKGWKNKDLLRAIGKETPSIVTKWLSGTHNFTLDTLVEIERALDIQLINLNEQKEEVVIKYHIVVQQETPVRNEYGYYSDAMISNKLNSGVRLSKKYTNSEKGNYITGKA